MKIWKKIVMPVTTITKGWDNFEQNYQTNHHNNERCDNLEKKLSRQSQQLQIVVLGETQS